MKFKKIISSALAALMLFTTIGQIQVSYAKEKTLKESSSYETEDVGYDTSNILDINMHDYTGDEYQGTPYDIINTRPINAGRPFTFQYFREDALVYPSGNGYGGSRWWNNYSQDPAKNPPERHQKGIFDNVLHNGYPALSKATGNYGYSLKYLFDNNSTAAGVGTHFKKLNKLFAKDRLTKYYTLDSSQDFVLLQPDGTFKHNTKLGPEYNSFTPLDSVTGYTDKRNMWFGMDVTGQFTIPEGKQLNGKDMIFDFAGDDDLLVYIDDVLVLDLGGVHTAVTGNINFTTGQVEEMWRTDVNNQADYGFIYHSISDSFKAAGKTWDDSAHSKHSIKVFYIERGYGGSTCKIKMNLPFDPLPDKPISNYMVTYKPNGGSGADQTQEVESGRIWTTKGQIFNKYGHVLESWNTRADGSGIRYGLNEMQSTLNSNLTLYAQWRETAPSGNHTVTYKANGGSGSDQTQSVTNGSTWVTKGAVFNKSGYALESWNTDQNGYGTRYELNSSQKALTNDLTLYAQWKPISQNDYIIIYDGNGHTSGSMPQEYVDFNAHHMLKKNEFKKTGYTFQGWTFDKSSTSVYYYDQDIVQNLARPGTSITLYAVWKKNPVQNFTVTYKANGGSGSDQMQSVTSDSAWTTKGAVFNKNDYTLESWNTDPNGNGTRYGLSATQSPISQNLTLYAQWTPNKYNVTYAPNGGSGSNQNQTVIFGSDWTTKGAIFSKSGYTLTSWNTDPNGKGTSYGLNAAQGRWKRTSNLTLYAQWTKNSYYLNLNGRLDGTESSNIKDFGTVDIYVDGVLKANDVSDFYQKVPYGAKYEIKDIRSVTGKHYVGVYSGSLSGTMPANNKDILLEFKTNTYKVVFNGNGATSGSTATQNFVYGTAQKLNSNGFTKTGYTFVGWATSPSGNVVYQNGASVNNLTATNNGTVNLYAKWTPNKYTVTYKPNGGTGSDQSQTVAYNSDWTTKNALFNKTGYTQTSWNTKPDGTGTKYSFNAAQGAWKSTSNLTLYAQYTPHVLTVRYHLNGAKDNPNDSTYGNGDPALTMTYNYKDGLPSYGLHDLTNDRVTPPTGYHIQGTWNTKANRSGSAFNFTTVYKLDQLNPAILNGNASVDLYGQYDPNKYTIVFDGNGSIGGTTPSINTKYDQAVTIPQNGFVKEPFEFIEWNTKPDGSGQSFKPGDKVSNLTSKDGDTVIIYAIWEEQVKVIYEGNGSTSGTRKVEQVDRSLLDTAYNYTVHKNGGYTSYARTKHQFDGWWWDADGKYAQNNASYFRDNKTNKVTWPELMKHATPAVKMSFRSVGFAALNKMKAANEIKEVTMYAQWDKAPTIEIPNDTDSKNLRTFYEGQTITEKDLVKTLKLEDVEDDITHKPLSARVVKIEYATGRLDNGNKLPGYTESYKNGMTSSDRLDTWFLEIEKNATVTHKVTYEVTDSAGNVTQAVGEVYVKYNQFPTITAEDRYFTLEEANAGKITAEAILNHPLADGSIRVHDTEEGYFTTVGPNTKQVKMLDFNPEEFKNFKEGGYRKVTLHTQDTYGPNDKGKETVKQITIYVVDDGEVPDANKAKQVRFIDKKNYDKNKDVVSKAPMTESQMEARNGNGGLNVNSVWYHDADYRNVIENTFNKKDGKCYNYTMEQVNQIKAYVDKHGIGNIKEENALANFANQFMK